MTYQELVATIKNLPAEQRISLMEVLAQSLRAELLPRSKRPSALPRIRGMLKANDSLTTDHDLKDDYTDYLIKKYS